jgi:hypothetical protein
VIFDGSVHEFYLRSSENCSERILPAVISFFEFFDCQAIFLPTFQRKRYHQPGECIHLKVNIADGSIPIKSNLRNNGS